MKAPGFATPEIFDARPALTKVIIKIIMVVYSTFLQHKLNNKASQ